MSEQTLWRMKAADRRGQVAASQEASRRRTDGRGGRLNIDRRRGAPPLSRQPIKRKLPAHKAPSAQK